MATRRRGGSFHEEIHGQYDNDSGIHFMTPYYHGDSGPEPLDLSKLRLDLDPDGDEEEEEEDEEEDEERAYSRGRSRSRSVHEYDDDSSQYMPNSEDGDREPSNSAESVMMRNAQNHSQQQNMNNTGKGERTGPLQHREVIALQKVFFPFHNYFIACSQFVMGRVLLLFCRVWKKQRSVNFILEKTKKSEWQQRQKGGSVY